MSPAHEASKITSKTRFGNGHIKTVANKNANITADLAEINAGNHTLLNNGDILTSSGRIYGIHPDPGRNTIFLRSGPDTVQLTQAEFSVFRNMITSGGLTGNALKQFNGMQKAGNAGLSPQSQQNLINLYNNR
jgi:hypothetical protein